MCTAVSQMSFDMKQNTNKRTATSTHRGTTKDNTTVSLSIQSLVTSSTPSATSHNS
eukprot:m.214080 g.214080  ORF g.214080 m.214080 type:complete len:56 (-) comp15094_c0_seq1:38-205(-)